MTTTTLQKSSKNFDQISHKLVLSDHEVSTYSEANYHSLKYKDTIFSVYHNGAMFFFLGPVVDPNKIGTRNAKRFSPFRSKELPMWWFEVKGNESSSWKMLADLALEFTKTLT